MYRQLKEFYMLYLVSNMSNLFVHAAGLARLLKFRRSKASTTKHPVSLPPHPILSTKALNETQTPMTPRQRSIFNSKRSPFQIENLRVGWEGRVYFQTAASALKDERDQK